MERPAPSPRRSWRTSQRVLLLGLLVSFGVLGLLVLLAGVQAGVSARHGRADLWLEAAAVTAPNVRDLSPGLSSARRVTTWSTWASRGRSPRAWSSTC
jgi:hypothetical protein